MPYEFLAKNGLISQGNITATGSLAVTQNISASATGSFGIVGIGTNSPLAALDVRSQAMIGDASIGGVAYQTLSVGGHTRIHGTYRLQFGSANGGYASIGITGTTTGTLTFNTWDATTDRERLRIVNTNGYIGVGTTNPSTLLQLNGDAASHQIFSINRSGSATPAVYIGNDSNSNALIASNNTVLRFGKDFTGTFNEYVRIDTNGNVGIGTTTVSRKLHTYIDTGPVMRLQSSGSNASIEFIPSSGHNRYNWLIGAQQNISDAFEITPSTATNGTTFSNPSILVKSDGNVGIGTTAPTARLHVSGSHVSGNGMSRFEGAEFSIISLKAPGTGDGTNGYWGFRAQDTSNNDLMFYGYRYTSTFSGFWVDPSFSQNITKGFFVRNSDGSVGIGTNSPSAKLHVNSSGSLAAGSVVFRVEGTSGSLFSVDDTLSGSLMSVNDITGLPILEVFSDDRVVMGTFNSNTLVVTGSRVGVGTSSPAFLLDVSGSSRHGSSASDVHQFTGSINLNGSLSTNVNITASNISASRTGSFGAVGIGTSNVDAKLTILGTSTQGTAYNAINLNNSDRGGASIGFKNFTDASVITLASVNVISEDAGSGNYNDGVFTINTAEDTTNLERFRITSRGHVGIGTTSPDIFGRSYNRILGISGSSVGIQLNSNTGTYLDLGINGTRIGGLFASSIAYEVGTPGNFPMHFYTSGSYKMSVLVNGNVGIGTTTPNSKLEVAGTAGTAIISVNNTTAGRSGSFGIDSAGVYIQNSNNGDYFDLKNATGVSRFRVIYDNATYLNTSFVSIGNLSATGSKLSVFGNLSVGSTYGSTAAPSNGAIFQGGVGIGTTNPYYAFDVYTNSTAGALMSIRASGSANARIYFDAANGDLSGGDYCYIGQESGSLNFVINTDVNSGNIHIQPRFGSATDGRLIVSGSSQFGRSLSSYHQFTGSVIGNFTSSRSVGVGFLGTSSWAATATTLSSSNISQFTNDNLYQYHRTDISSLSSSANLSQPLNTFDKANITNAPTTDWYNGWMSTHGNYLHSIILNRHRSSDWYVGYMEESVGTATDPTWYKLLHSGNYNTYAPTLTGTGASGTWSITSSMANALNSANSYTVGSLTSTVQASGATGTLVSYVTPGIYALGSSTGNGIGLISNTSFANQGAIANIGLHQVSASVNDITAGVYMSIGGWHQNSGTGLPVYIGGGYTSNSSSILSVVPTNTAGAGNVGIGTRLPGYKLDVNGDIRAMSGSTIRLQTSAGQERGTFQATDTTGAGGAGLAIATSGGEEIAFKDSADVNMVIKGTGRVGIGTITPAEMLHISSSNNTQLRLESGADAAVQFVGPDTHSYAIGMDDSDDKFKISYNASRTPPGLGTNDRFVIDTSGNVGIGTVNPGNKLEVASSAFNRATFKSIGNFQTGIQILRSGSFDTDWELYAPASSTDLRLYNSSDLVTFKSNGNVGIGLSTPNNKLHVYNSGGSSTTASNAIAVFEQNSNAGIQVCVPDASEAGLFFSRNGAPYYSAITRNGTDLLLKNGSATAVTINSSRNVGIGTTNPTFLLDVSGSSRFGFTSTNTHQFTGSVSISPTLNVGGVTYNDSIDIDKFDYFTLQPYIEAGNFPSNVLSLANGTAPTFTTLTGSDCPFGKVAYNTTVYESIGDYIPVNPGETLYGEIWALRNIGSSGIDGTFHIGVARYDKNKNPIATNLGLTYFVANGVTIPTSSVWTMYSGTTTLPTTHTPFGGSDGGPVRYVRPYVIVNYNTGTIPTYWGAFKIRKQQLTRDAGNITISGSLGIGTSTASSKLTVVQTTGADSVLLELQSNNDPGIRFGRSTYGSLIRHVSAATDYIAFNCNGSSQPAISANAQVVFNENGNVGIGTISPTSLLELSSSTATNPLNVKGVGSWGTSILVISSSGKIGFGTNSPSYAVHVQNYSTAQSGMMYINAALNSSGKGLVIDTTTRTSSENSVLALEVINTSGTNTLAATVGGNVGIGITNPAAKLAVTGSGTGQMLVGDAGFGSGNYTGISVNGTLSTTAYNILSSPTDTNLYINRPSGNDIRFRENNQDQIVLLAGGNVGVGTSTPSAKVQISGSANSVLLNVKSPVSGNIVYVTGSGAVGINTATPAYTLQVNGSFAATTKSFVIDHPTKPDKKLVYGSLESPYHGIRLTGRDTLIDGKCVVELPDYISKLVLPETVNIQLTGIKCNKVLYVDEINIKENNFTVAYDKGVFESYKDYDFFWDFTAIRADVPQLKTEI